MLEDDFAKRIAIAGVSMSAIAPTVKLDVHVQVDDRRGERSGMAAKPVRR